MPVIKQFDTPALGLRPTETGIETVAGNARRVGAFYNQEAGSLEGLASAEGNAFRGAGRAIGGGLEAAGDIYVNKLANDEISHGSAVGTEALAKLDQSLNDAVKNADPNDRSFAPKFMEQQFLPWAEKFAKQFTTEKGQQFAEGLIEKYRQHFTTKAAADISTQAGIAARENASKTVNNLTTMVYNDPSSLDTAIDTLKHSAGHIVDSSPTINAETGARVKSELNQKGVESLVKSAAVGYIDKTGKLPPWLDKYPDAVNAAELHTLQKQAERQAKTDAAMARQDALLKRQQADQDMHAGSNKIITENVTIDEQTGKPVIDPKFFKQTLDLARKNPDAPSAASTVRTMLDWAESQQNKEHKAVDDPATVKALTDRLFDPANPTTDLDLMRAQTQGKLSDHTFQQLSRTAKELQETPLKGPVYQNTMKAAHDALIVNIPGVSGKDNVGSQKYAQFVQSFVPQYLSKYRAGTLDPNALDINDPNSMISKAMAPFKRTTQQRLQDYLAGLEGLGTAAPARVSTKAEYDALPSKARYISAKDGQTYEKP